MATDIRQIDLGEAILAAKQADAPLTVRDVVELANCSESRVRRAIAEGHIEADRPMLITGGDMPLSVREWQIALGPATRRIKAHVMAWEGNSRVLKVLDRSGQLHTFKIPALKHEADKQCKEIDRLDCARDEGGTQ